MQLSVPEMSCGHCRAAVTEALQGLDPAARVEVDLPTRRVALETTASPAQVVEALAGVGFEAKLI